MATQLAKQLDLVTLSSAVSGNGVAFRCCAKLQPAGGEGTKVFPPTYAGSVYATEKRRLPGSADPVECVLLDSVQSQANRMEEALQQALDAGRIKIPVVEVDFTPYFPGDKQPDDMRLLDPVGKVSSLQAPHRIADAILRDSMLNGAQVPRDQHWQTYRHGQRPRSNGALRALSHGLGLRDVGLNRSQRRSRRQVRARDGG